MSWTNPLLDDRDVAFLLDDVLEMETLLAMPAFAEHTRESIDLVLSTCRRFARDVLLPTYRQLDQEPPVLERGRVRLHPKMREIYPQLMGLGLTVAPRPKAAGGQDLPLVADTLANAYLVAGNLGAAGLVMLSRGTAHLVEAFGSRALKDEYMHRLYSGEWTGTMALTEPHAGSSLGDLRTTARPTADGRYLVKGSKIFISGADHDLTPNIVHLVLARIEGAPPGTKGISLFAVPRMRREGDGWAPNDVAVTGLIHKIGYRALPSLAIDFGEHGDCRGDLVGQPGQGLHCMFQMMNAARIAVGLASVATASVAYQEALAYARDRLQGRPIGARGGEGEQVPIIEHADVRRMLLRQKAIVEGSLSLVAWTARYADIASHHPDPAERVRAQGILDLLTPVAKTVPAEKGYESNVLAAQIHGGYGYSSELPLEAWVRDQRLNSIHEGTTGIQGLDLLGRKVMAKGGETLRALAADVARTVGQARDAGVSASLCDRVASATCTVVETTMHLGALGLAGDVTRMMLHSADYLEMVSLWLVGWQWLAQAAAATRRLGAARPEEAGFYEGKLCAAAYFIETDVPRVDQLAWLCRSGEDSYGRMKPEWF